MKPLLFLDKCLFFINSLLAILLLVTYLIPYINPETYPIVAILSLTYPSLLALNLGFVLWWIVKLKKQFLLSLIVIVFGFKQTQALFSFAEKKTAPTEDTIGIFSFNVRQFNRFQWIKSKTIKQDIGKLIEQQNADIVCFQEFANTKNFHIPLPKVIDVRKSSIGLAIFSKYPAIHTGSFTFKNTSNNIVFADLKIHTKIVRVYNVHLQSFRLDSQKEYYGNMDHKALLKRFKEVFKEQSRQVKALKKHLSTCPYPSIIVGDFNNTAFSWNYKQLTQNHTDAFVAAGSGFGKTYNHFFPFRIDFILTSKEMVVNSFTSFKQHLSDHFAIMARVNLNN